MEDPVGLFFQNAPVGMCILGRNLEYLYINQRLAELNNLSVDESLGRGLSDATPALALQVEPLCRYVLKTDKALPRVEHKLALPMEPHRRRLWLMNYFPLHSTGGAVSAVGLTVEEVTQVVNLHERALESSAEAIFIADLRIPDQPIIYVNSSFEDVTGFPALEILGRSYKIIERSSEESEVKQKIEDAVLSGRACSFERVAWRKNGVTVHNRLCITPVRDLSGEITHLIGRLSESGGALSPKALNL